MKLDSQFHFSDVSFSNISVLKKTKLVPNIYIGSRAKNYNHHKPKIHAASRTQAKKTHMNHNVKTPAISLGVVFFWYVSLA